MLQLESDTKGIKHSRNLCVYLDKFAFISTSFADAVQLERPLQLEIAKVLKATRYRVYNLRLGESDGSRAQAAAR